MSRVSETLEPLTLNQRVVDAGQGSDARPPGESDSPIYEVASESRPFARVRARSSVE
jgi:hypothetical protein